jgi:lysophospholipase L1-like esterase
MSHSGTENPRKYGDLTASPSGQDDVGPYDDLVNRVWTALLLLATVVVAGGVVYVVGHNTKVRDAGDTPGVSTAVSAPPAVTPTSTASSTSSTSTSHSPSTSSSASTSATSAVNSSTLVAFIGDDYTHGLGGSGAAKTFPVLVAKSLGVHEERFYLDGAGYAKASANGQTYGDLVSQVVATHPQVVVVSGGRNDRADNVATLTSDAASLFSALHAALPKAELIAVAPWWGDSAHPAELIPVDQAVQAGVTGAGGVYLDIPDPLYDHSSWMADDADPNDLGYAAIAASLEPKLKALLPS